jgi:hypothetical protein
MNICNLIFLDKRVQENKFCEKTMLAGQRGRYVTGNQNIHNAEPGLFPSSFFST